MKKLKVFGYVIGCILSIALFCTLRAIVEKMVYAVFGFIQFIIVLRIMIKKETNYKCDAFYLITNGIFMIIYAFTENEYLFIAAFIITFIYASVAYYNHMKEHERK